MKAQKGLMVLATVSLLGLSVACSDRYQQGLADGKAQGYQEGYSRGTADGEETGFQRAKAYFASADYNAGYADGDARGYTRGFGAGQASGDAAGYSRGYGVGKNDGIAIGRAQGYDTGYNDGYLDGADSSSGDVTAAYNRGYNDGTADGYDLGHQDGATAGYNVGYDDGFGDGYDVGYGDGFSDGSLSVGSTKKLQGYANILSMAHNDIFDYSKIKAPKSTARGLVANGKLLFEDSSLTNKDTLKRAAVVEQYLVVEMAKQVKGKFGLSDERSLKIAKASNHFRKFSTTRALTSEDTSAFSEEIIGADLKSIEKAYDGSRKGDISSFQSILEKAAQKNGTSPEKMAQIVTKMFI